MIKRILEQKLLSTPLPQNTGNLILETFDEKLDKLYARLQQRYLPYFGSKYSHKFVDSFEEKLAVFLETVDFEDLSQELELFMLEAKASKYDSSVTYNKYRDLIITLVQSYQPRLLAPLPEEKTSIPFYNLDYILAENWLNSFQKQLLSFFIERDWTPSQLASFYNMTERNVRYCLTGVFEILENSLPTLLQPHEPPEQLEQHH